FLGDLLRLVAVLYIEDREAADDLLRFDERPVGDDPLPVFGTDRAHGLRALELLASNDLAALGVLVEPTSGSSHGGLAFIGGHALETILVFRGTDEKQHELHGQPPHDVRRTMSLEIRPVSGRRLQSGRWSAGSRRCR